MVTRERAMEVEAKLRELAAKGDGDEFGLIKRWKSATQASGMRPTQKEMILSD